MHATGRGGHHREIRHLVAAAVHERRRGRRRVGAGGIDVEPDEQPLGARELPADDRRRTAVGRERLHVARGAAAEHARRRDDDLRRGEVGNLDAPVLAVERAGAVRTLDREPQIELAGRGLERHPLRPRRGRRRGATRRSRSRRTGQRGPAAKHQVAFGRRGEDAQRARRVATRAGGHGRRLPDQRHLRLASRAPLRTDPGAHIALRLDRPRQRRQRGEHRLRGLLGGRRRPQHVGSGGRPISTARARFNPAALDPHLDLVELAVGGRPRAVPEQVVEARVAHHLLQPLVERVAVDDGAPVGLLGQRTQRVLGHLQRAAVGGKAGRRRRIVQPELEHRQPARVERIDRRVVAVRHLVDVAHAVVHVRLPEPRGGFLDRGILQPALDARLDRVLGLRRVLPAHLRRQNRGEAFADEDHRLPPLAQRPEPHGQAAQRPHHHLVPNPFDRLGGITNVVLFNLVHRPVVVLPPLEPVDGADDRGVVARERHVEDWRERIHHCDHVVGPQLRLDEARQRLAHRHRVRAPHVVVVEQDREDADVVARRLGLFVVAVADRARRRVARLRIAVHLDQAELLHRLRLVVLEDVEVFLLEVGDVLPFPVGRNHVHADEVDAAAEDRGRVLPRNDRRNGGVGGRRLRGRRLGRAILALLTRLRCRLTLLRGQVRADRRKSGDADRHARGAEPSYKACVRPSLHASCPFSR